ncbi:inosine 5'-monophosphate dehydrogenase [Mariprofundus micogutta]|uniref:Inosine 5'-monophosphate dehydrogenase n=1 Tax=Mariprofundus micogutta TaxID=1921010 RepID=A0A1L8CMH6_9PROT|nr:CBS domain-containing protein [Mariprofundus micogutta]GAV20130.1 inosine 5'-monophosphate dehydrogenase [Mariprofundus micogutta]
MLAKNVMSTDLVSLQLGATVRDAIALFQESSLHDFPVIDDQGKPVGIVTSRSILHCAVPRYASDELLAVMKAGPDIESVYNNLAAELDRQVSDVLERNFDEVKGDMPTSAVAAMLTHLKGDSRNILVVDEAGRLIGIISARDIICRLPEKTEV